MLSLLPGETGSILSFTDEDWLKSAVWMSLGTDRRAKDDDVLPCSDTDKRGYWGDTYRPRPLGSRLWLLCREKQLNSVLLRAEEYAHEALQWLIDDAVAGSVKVSAAWARRGWLALSIEITKPSGENHRYRYLWSQDYAV